MVYLEQGVNDSLMLFFFMGAPGCGRSFHMQNFYRTTKWKRLRESILRRDGYMCQLSKRYGKRKQAEVVHHIFPREEYPQYQWESWNLISLTREQHNRLHDRITDELTSEGLALLKKTARARGMTWTNTKAENRRGQDGMTY